MISCDEEPDLKPNPDFVYFLVAEKNPDKGDSFILPLLNPNDIAEARAIIDNPDEPKIILAEITRDNAVNYHKNKDLLKNQQWSWHVAEFIGFVDFTIEIYDGWPKYVEDNYTEWVDITKGPNGNGRIGFWEYTVVREVQPSELQ